MLPKIPSVRSAISGHSWTRFLRFRPQTASWHVSEGLPDTTVSAQTFRLSRRTAVFRFIALTRSVFLIDTFVSR